MILFELNNLIYSNTKKKFSLKLKNLELFHENSERSSLISNEHLFHSLKFSEFFVMHLNCSNKRQSCKCLF